MNDYERVARVIRWLDERHTSQPDLAGLARAAGLSMAHFHRLFVKWAGVTPKDFLQALTARHARQLLLAGGSVLDAALATGLSGPGRLHDLCVTLEAASPGEIKSGGAGWTLEAGFAPSPFGTLLAATGPRGICHLAFVDKPDKEGAWERLRAAWPNARLQRNDVLAANVSQSVFQAPAGERRPSGLRAYVRGTEFQVRVWRALLEVPPGRLVSYQQLATHVGSPSAARVVGSAVGQNPLAGLIPCHRVIRTTGVLGDYRWGATRKRAIIGWETAAAR